MKVSFPNAFALLLICLFSFAQLQADPWDCMSQDEAERLADHLLENPYVVDYCDPCDDLAAKYDNDRLPAFLMLVSNPRVVKCGWDEERYSVQVDFRTLVWGYTEEGYWVKDWRPIQEIPKDKQPGPVYMDDPRYCITLNYHWTLVENKPSRFCFPIGFNLEMPNDGLHSFPSADVISDKKIRKAYSKWLKRKKRGK